jgi:predicted PurR-regulated permease PerM
MNANSISNFNRASLVRATYAASALFALLSFYFAVRREHVTRQQIKRLRATRRDIAKRASRRTLEAFRYE